MMDNRPEFANLKSSSIFVIVDMMDRILSREMREKFLDPETFIVCSRPEVWLLSAR